MMKKLIAGVFVTAVAAMPIVAHADWDDLKQRGDNLEQKGQDLKQRGEDTEQRGEELKARGEAGEARGKADVQTGRVVEEEGVTTYHKGRDYEKRTTHKVRHEKRDDE